jgi:hypothetical protein
LMNPMKSFQRSFFGGDAGGAGLGVSSAVIFFSPSSISASVAMMHVFVSLFVAVDSTLMMRLQLRLQVLLESDGLVMSRVLRTVDQGDSTPRGCIPEWPPCFRPLVQLHEVHPLEFLPPDWIVSEPLAQPSTRGGRSHPGGHPYALLRHASGPDSVHEEPLSISGRAGLIDTLCSYVRDQPDGLG